MFDPAVLFLSLVARGAGFVLLVYGRKQGSWPHLVAGLAYMVYPYFVDSATAILLVGVVIALGLWFAVRAGW